MKKAITILGSLALVAMLSLPALGYGPGYGREDCDGFGPGRGQGPCCGKFQSGLNLTDEQRDQLDALHDQFYMDTRDLRRTIRDKAREMRTLMEGDTIDEAAALALQKELHELRGQMMVKRLQFELESRKIAPELKNFHGKRHASGHHGQHGGGHKGMGRDGYGCRQ